MPRTAAPAAVGPVVRAEVADAVFVPADPVRRSSLALWAGPAGLGRRGVPPQAVDLSGLAEHAAAIPTGEIELVLPAGRSVRTVAVTARLIPWSVALDWLVELAPTPDVPASLAAWAVVARTATDLVARGRLSPSVSPAGFDTWRLGLLGPDDEQRLDAIAAAMPAWAHALAWGHGGSGPKRIADPHWLVRRAADAVADVLVRTAAARHLVASPAWAAVEPIEVGELQPWVQSLEHDLGLGAGARPGIRLEIPFGDTGDDLDAMFETPSPSADASADDASVGDSSPGDARPAAGDRAVEPDPIPPVQAVLQLRSKQDPSLVVDAADLWDAPAAVLARLGEQAEIDLLLALPRGAAVWPPLGRALDDARPGVLDIDDEEAFELLGPPAEALAAAGFEVLWPAGVFTSVVELRAHVSAPTPSADSPSGFDLDALVAFDWQASLGGQPLTAAELAQLAEAKRPLIRLRGRWVTADPQLLERLRSGGRIRAGDALAAALSGTLVVDGEPVEAVVDDGPITDLADRLRQVIGAAAGDDADDETDQIGGIDDRGAPRRRTRRRAGRMAELPEPPGLEATLRPYQRRGLAWMAAMTELGVGGCLADDMGLGKTVQLIALHVHRHPSAELGGDAPASPRTGGPTLVICPTSLLGNWEREVNRFAPTIPVRRFHGGERSLDDVADDEIVLATYGVLRRDAEALAAQRWGLVVADEAQHAKNPLSRTARALRTIPAGARLALTGTPVENRLTELWAILDWTTPGLLGPLEAFKRTVAVPVERHHDERATERLAAAVRPFLLRRRKSDPGIAPELPPKTERDIVVPLTVEQVTLYEATVREALETIRTKSGIARRGLVLKLLTSLKQITNHPAQYLGQDGPLPGRSGKLDALDELLDVILSEGESTLVFTQYVQMGRLLERHLADRSIPTMFLHGRVPVTKRQEMVDRFQAGDVPVLLLSLKAGGTGLNLTRATHVVHVDRWWNPAVEDQATDRAYRIGQDRPVQVHRLITEGTIEDKIGQLLEAKRGLAESVVGAGEAWIGDLSDDDLADLVSLPSVTPRRKPPRRAPAAKAPKRRQGSAT